MTLATRTPPSSPFDTSGPSLILPKMGRIKSDHQRQQDATRVNGYSDTARSTSGDKTKAIVGKPNWARSQ